MNDQVHPAPDSTIQRIRCLEQLVERQRRELEAEVAAAEARAERAERSGAQAQRRAGVESDARIEAERKATGLLAELNRHADNERAYWCERDAALADLALLREGIESALRSLGAGYNREAAATLRDLLAASPASAQTPGVRREAEASCRLDGETHCVDEAPSATSATTCATCGGVPCALCGSPVESVVSSTMPVLCGCDQEEEAVHTARRCACGRVDLHGAALAGGEGDGLTHGAEGCAKAPERGGGR